MSEELYGDGFTSIVNIDFAPNVIEHMTQRAKQNGILHPPQQPQQDDLFYYLTMDCTDMSAFADQSFDGILDKGTVDSIMCSLDGDEMIDRMYSEISRLLNKVNIKAIIAYLRPFLVLIQDFKDAGVFTEMSFRGPHARRRALERPKHGWALTSIYEIQKGEAKARDILNEKERREEGDDFEERGSGGPPVIEKQGMCYIYILKMKKEAEREEKEEKEKEKERREPQKKKESKQDKTPASFTM